MGGLTSQFEDLSLPRETQGFARWRLEDVVELRRRFSVSKGYCMVLDQLVALISFKKELHEDISLSSIFRLLDCGGRGRIDGLEFIAALALCCKAPLPEKVKFCFELFDFNMNAQLSEAEMVMMMQCTVSGMLTLMGGGLMVSEIGSGDFERLGREAVGAFDKDGSGNISYEEFTDWARSNREVMSCIDRLDALSADIGDDEDENCGAISAEDEWDTDDDEYIIAEKALGRDARHRHFPLNKRAIDSEWNGFVVEPTNWKPESGSTSTHFAAGLPESNLRVVRVNGFRSRDIRNNVKFVKLAKDREGNQTKGAVWCAATLAVVHDLESGNQSYCELTLYILYSITII